VTRNLERINTGYAALGVDSGDVPSEESTIVHGVALGEGDTTIGGSGKQTYWPADVLKEAAEGLQGQPLATDMNHTADDPKQQTPVDAVVGEVTWSGYAPGIGVVYEAELDDESLAEKVANGRLEVSPLVARDLEPREEGNAEYEATEIHRWRDLALVVNGAAPSNEITVGDNPMKAEALHKAVESLQDGIDLTPPQDVQDHAQEVLDWRSDDEKDVQGMTDTGWSRAEQLASGEELSVDDVQEIAAWFARHGSEEYDLNEEGMDPWRDNGRVAIKGWGGPPMRSWIMDKREQLTDMGELEAMSEALQLSEARTPEYDGTETSDWSEVSKDLSDTVDAVGIDAESVSDLSGEQKQAIAEHTLLGDPDAESWRELFFFPVVNPNTGDLNENALDAVRGGRGAQADIPSDTYESAESVARNLLAEEFDREFESMAEFSDLSDGDLVEWDSSGGMAQGRIVDLRDEGEPDYDDEIDGDVTVSPPAALIEIVGMDDGEVVGQDTMVAHKPDTLSMIEESDVEAMAEHGDMDENMADVPDEFVFDNPGEAVEKAQEMGLEGPADEIIHEHGEGENITFMPAPSHGDLMDMIDADEESADEAMWSTDPAWATQSDDRRNGASSVAADDETNSKSTMNETEKDILSAAESVEEPVAALEAHAAAEEPTVVEQDTYESMRNTLADALKDKTGLKDSTVEAMSFNALVGEFEDDEGNLKAEALTQTPETEQPDPDGEEALSDDTRAKAEALMADYDAGFTAVKSELCDTLDVESVSEAREVLN